MRNFLFLILLINYSYGAHASSSDELYLEKRNMFIQKLSKANSDEAYENESKYLIILEDMLTSYIQKLKVNGFESKGKINLETLIENEYGFGALDGIEYLLENGDETIVTSRELFEKYLLEHSDLPDEVDQALNSETLVTKSSALDASATFLGKIPIKLKNPELLVSAYLFNSGQESNIYGAGMLFIALASNGTVVIVTMRLKQQAPENPSCRNIFNMYEKKLDESEESNESANKARYDIYYLGVRKYVECQIQHYDSSVEYKIAAKQAQDIVDNIEYELSKSSIK